MQRGLPHLRTTVDALPTLTSKKAFKLFGKLGVLNERELSARADVLWEKYTTITAIEARTMVSLLRKNVLPPALRYQTEVGQAVSIAQTAGVDFEDTWGQLHRMVQMVDELRASAEHVASLEAEIEPIEDAERRAMHCRDKLIPAMERARAASDALEAVIPADLWQLPTYAQMLFQR
jgi:glutamine synthetase